MDRMESLIELLIDKIGVALTLILIGMVWSGLVYGMTLIIFDDRPYALDMCIMAASIYLITALFSLGLSRIK